MKNSENLIFFKGLSLGRKSGNDGRRRRPTTATTRRRRRPTMTVDGEKISSTHFAKNLGFQKNCEFLKNSENLIFFKGPSLGRKSGNDGRRRRPTTATTDDGDDRRRASTAKKSHSLILLKILDFRKIASFFEKLRKSDFFQRSLPWTKKWK